MFKLILDRLYIYLRLARLNQPIGIFLLLWPTLMALWISSLGTVPIGILLIFIFGTIIMRSAGCVINDYADIDFDKHVERTKLRPLADNLISKKEAIYIFLFLIFMAFLCLIPLNWYTFRLSIISLIFAVIYPFTKRFFPIPQFFLGISFSFGILMAYSSILNYLPIDSWILFIANLFWILAYDTIYAMSDKECDMSLAVYSSAITFGRYDIIFIIICYIVFDILLLLLNILRGIGIYFYISIFLIIFLQIYIIYNIRGRDKLKCFQSFLQNNYIGLILFIGIILDYLI